MKKILSILTAATVLLAFTGCSSGESAKESTAGGDAKGEPKILKIAHGASESYHMHRAWLKFKEGIEATGLFKVEIYPSSQFGNDAEMVESVKTGDLTIAVPPSSFLTDEVPSMALIELPYVFNSREAAIETLDGSWGKNQLSLLESSGLHGLGYMENGLRHLTNSKKTVKTPDDLQGLKLRTMQVPAHVFYWNSMGCSAEGAPFPELYTNLSTKVFDGEENPIAHIHAQKFYEVQSHLTLTGHVYTTYVPVMTTDFWNSLKDEERTVIQEAFDEAYKYQLDLVSQEESRQLDEISANTNYKCEVTELTADEKQTFIESAKPTLEKYREDLGEDVYDEFTKAVEAATTK